MERKAFSAKLDCKCTIVYIHLAWSHSFTQTWYSILVCITVYTAHVNDRLDTLPTNQQKEDLPEGS